MSHPYATLAYGRSLGHIGEAIPVPEWGCCVLARPIERGGHDGVGTYPIAALPAQADLRGGLERLRELGLVSVTLALDDFHRPPLSALEAAFDTVRPFKPHYVHRSALGRPELGKHHSYEVRRALKAVAVGPLDLAREGEAWNGLYRRLGLRHALGAQHLFEDAHVAALATLEGVHAFAAWSDEELVSAHIWVLYEGRAHSHLAASSDRGYALRAAYAVNAAALERFAGCEIVNFGGGAGISADARDGLSRFKSGFSNSTAPSYICGAILRPDDYARLAAGADVASGYFPAYRSPGRAA